MNKNMNKREIAFQKVLGLEEAIDSHFQWVKDNTERGCALRMQMRAHKAYFGQCIVMGSNKM